MTASSPTRRIFPSNSGIISHAGRMVRVDEGNWDKNRRLALNHKFNREWLRHSAARALAQAISGPGYD